ncbi:Hypothetical protein CINCED_3A024310 [Cinara cedri]|uniref:Uncharacterized protein n=1 Tax=Cinara cedri TaxID=506608 RepID=A0A5E4MMI6_9HEMI|nr:Hypothetical protein CINCED_3A024310 [Cinara cedri]
MKYWTTILCVTFVLIKLNGINGHFSYQTYADNSYGHNVHHLGKHNGASPLFVKTIVNLLRFLSAHPKLVQKSHPSVIIQILTHLSSKPALLAAVPQTDLENFMSLVFGTPNLVNNIPESLLISLISSATITSPGLFGLPANQQPISDFSPYYTYVGGDFQTNPQADQITFVPLPPTAYPRHPQTPVVPCPPKTSAVPGVSVVKEVGVSVIPQPGSIGGVQAVADVAAGVSLPTAGGVPQPPQTPAVPGVSVVKEVGVSVIPQAGSVGGVQAVADVAAGVSLPTAGGVPQPPQTPAVPGVSVVEEVGVSLNPQQGSVGGVQAVADVAAGVSFPQTPAAPCVPQTPAAPCVPHTPEAPYVPQPPAVPYVPQPPTVPYVPQPPAVPYVPQPPAPPCVPQSSGPATTGTGTVAGVDIPNAIKTNGIKLLLDAISQGKPIIPLTTVHEKLTPIIKKFQTTGTALHQHKQLLHEKLTDLLNKHHSALPGKHPY